MKTKILMTLFTLTTSLTVNAQKFEKVLKKNSLTFEKPADFNETEIIKNQDLYYNYAIKLIQDSFEVRYSIFPLYPLFKDYNKSLDDPKITSLDPNKYHLSMFMVNILNVSQSGMENMPSITDFPKEAVKQEFGADYGGTSFFEANSEFGKDYKFCLMVALHKKDVADVYISFLGNNREKFDEYMLKAFHALKFQ